MEPTTVTCSTACTVTHVITVNVPPFNLTEEQGGLIAGAILAIWALAWAFRMFVRTVKETDGDNHPEKEES